MSNFKLRLLDANYQPQSVTVDPNTLVVEAIHLMSLAQASCLLVIEQQKLVGILTERDVVKAIANKMVFAQMTVAQLMLQPVITLNETELEDITTVLQRFRQHHIRHLPVINAQGEVLGVVTPVSVRNALQPGDLLKLRTVADVMETAVVSAPAMVAVKTIVHLMSQHDISCVVIVAEQQENQSELIPIGILTERDIIKLQSQGLDLVSTLAGEVIGDRLMTIAPQDTLWIAYQRMEELGIRRLVVTGNNGELLGIITQTSVLRTLDPIELCEMIATLQQIIDHNKTELAQEIAQRQQISHLLWEREAHYRVSEARLNDILNSAIANSIVSFRVFSNYTWEYEYQSPGCEALFGYTSQEIMQDKNLWMSRVHPQDVDTVIMPLFADIFVEKTTSVEFRFAHKDGSLRWISATYTSRYDAENNCWIVTGISTDISKRKQTEAALRESEERWQLAIAGTDEAIWDWNILTDQTFRSDRWFEMLGYERHELGNWDGEWSKRLHPDDYERVMAAQAAYLSQQAPSYSCEYRLRLKDGSYGWFRSRAKAVWNEAGQPIRLVGSLGNIGDRKQTELALQEREAMLRKIGDNLPNGAIYQLIRELDGSDRFSYMSAGIEKIMEIKAEDALKDSSFLYNQVIAEDIPRLAAAGNESMQHLSIFNIQLRICTPSGQMKWVQLRSLPHRLSDGRVVWDGLIVDVTEIKNTETTLRNSEAKLATTQKIAHVGSWELDLKTYQRTWSTETFEIFGLSSQQPEPTHAEFLQMVHPDDRTAVDTQMLEAIIHRTPFSLEYRIIRPDGSIRYLEAKAEVALDSQGKAAKLVGAILDITERKQTELEIIHSRDLREAIFNESADALFLVDSATLLTTDCNQQALAMFGASSKAELIGIQGHTLHKQQCTPEESAAYIAQMNQQGFWSQEIEYLTKQGHTFWGNLAVKRIRVAGEDMNLVRVTDISEQQAALRDRQQAEAAIARKEEQLRLTLEFTHIGTWDWNLQTGEVVWNDYHYRLLGLHPGTSPAHYQMWHDAVHPEDVNRVEQSISIALQNHTNFADEYRVIYPDGSIHWVNGRGRGIYNEAGEPIRMLGVILDITDRKQAEANLEASEARFQEIARTISQLFFVRSAITGEFIYVSPAYEQIWQRSCESLYQNPQSWLETIHPDDHPIVNQSLQQQFAGNSVQREYRIIRPDGEIRWLFAQINLVRDQAGNPLRFIGMAVDISDRKRAEQALQEKEQFLRSIYNSVGQAIFVVDVIDNDFRYVGLNQTHEILTGLNSNDIQGKTPEQILPPDLAAMVRQHYQDCVNARETINYEESLSFQGQPTWWITSLTPLQDEHGNIYRIVGNGIDISDRKRTEQMLELQAVIARNMAEGICLVRSDDGVIVYTNPKLDQMFGYESGELIGQHISVINYADDQITATEIYTAIAATVTQQGEITYEIQNVKKDGTAFWCSATTSVFQHPEYGMVFVAVQQDITEQKQAEEKIKASLKEKEVLLKEIHHRVKNNLGIVSSLLQMQCRRTQDPQATAILRDSQNRIASIALVHEKLYRSDDLANINFSQYIPDLTTHLFDSYNVSSNHIQLKIEVANINLDIETAIPCGLIINELVSNALKYAFSTQIKGEIQVRLSQTSNNTFILIVKDNGVGLPAEFDSKKTKTLGINLIQGLVKQLRGSLEINSHQGTEFKISFTAGRI